MWSRFSFLLFGSIGCYGYWSYSLFDKSNDIDLIYSDIPLVLIPGLKGSILCNKDTNKISFVSPKQSLSKYWNESLELPLTWINNKQDNDNNKSIGILKSICFLPSLCWKVYDDIVIWGEQHNINQARPFYVFHYDWRRELGEITDDFEKFINDISIKHNKPVQVIAHSMGGVITMAAINSLSKLFHSVIFVGVPFGTGIGYLEDLETGNPLGYNNTAFTPEILFTFASSYWTFPYELEQCNYYTGIFDYNNNKKWVKSLVTKSYTSYSIPDALSQKLPEKPDSIPLKEEWELNKINIDFYNANSWYEHKLGLFASITPKNEEEKQLMLLHLQTALDCGLKFRKRFQYKENINYPPITVISSNAYPTLVTILKNGPKSTNNYDYISAPRVEGDGRIPYDRSFPDKRIGYKKILSSKHHQILLDDIPLLKTLLEEYL